MKFLAAVLVISLSVFAVACSGDDDDPDPTATSPASPSVTVPASSPTAAASATSEATATAAASATTVPPIDGTVFPQNAGSTDAFPLKSLPDPNTGIYTLTDVRVGAHPESGGWDRIVFEFEDVEGFPGAHPSGIVEYVDETAQCGSGAPVDVEGEAILRVKLDATQAHNDAGQLTIDGTEIDGPGNSILEAVGTCDFEGVVEWAVGISGEENFKVTYQQDPSRLVIDVKWP